MVDKARNDLSAAVPRVSLALEEHRRTPEGRVRTSQELLTNFFPHDDKACTDRIFKYLPNEVRGPIIAAWGIRGVKAALRDNDEKIQSVLHDALVAGDVDHTAFEDGLTPETIVRWLPLADLWAFWRGSKLTKQAILKALSTAYELYLFDARWFLDTVNAKGRLHQGDGRSRRGIDQGRPHAMDPQDPRGRRRHAEGDRGRVGMGQDRRQDCQRRARVRSRRDGGQSGAWSFRPQPRNRRPNCPSRRPRSTARRKREPSLRRDRPRCL